MERKNDHKSLDGFLLTIAKHTDRLTLLVEDLLSFLNARV